MRSHGFVLAPVIALCLLRSAIPAQTTTPQEPAPSAQLITFETVPEPPQPVRAKISEPTIEDIEFRGARRLPQSTLRVLIASRVGGAYDIETLRRDSEALNKTGRFSDIVWETEPGRAGVIVRFTVVERPLIQSIEYQGDDTVTVPEILERLNQRKVDLRVDSLFKEDELRRAAVMVQELVSERGRQNITVIPLVEPSWPPLTVKITFTVEEKR
jgi:outer membrane protein assembly factor BamA